MQHLIPVTREHTVTVLTGALVAMWMASATIRLWYPWPAAAVLDSVMPVIVGYWFVAKKRTPGSL